MGMLHEELVALQANTTSTTVLGGAEEVLSPEISSQTFLLSYSVINGNILWHWLATDIDIDIDNLFPRHSYRATV
jgi:hypothetical protein